MSRDGQATNEGWLFHQDQYVGVTVVGKVEARNRSRTGKGARKQHAAQLVQPVLFVPLTYCGYPWGVDNDVEHLGIILRQGRRRGRLSWLFPCTYSFITVWC